MNKLYATMCCLQQTQFRPENMHRLKVERCKDTFHADSHQKKAGVSKLITDKIDFKSKTFRGE